MELPKTVNETDDFSRESAFFEAAILENFCTSGIVKRVRISSTFSVLRPLPYMATRWHLSIQFIVDRKAKMIFYNIHYTFY